MNMLTEKHDLSQIIYKSIALLVVVGALSGCSALTEGLSPADSVACHSYLLQLKSFNSQITHDSGNPLSAENNLLTATVSDESGVTVAMKALLVKLAGDMRKVNEDTFSLSATQSQLNSDIQNWSKDTNNLGNFCQVQMIFAGA